MGSRGKEEKSEASSSVYNMLAAMQQQMKLFQQQMLGMQEQQQQQQQQQAVAASEQRRTAAAAAQRQSFALSSHLMSPAVGEPSAGALLPIPPRVPAQHRASFGRPSTPIASIPFTPVAQRAAAAAQGEAHPDEDDGQHDDADDVAAAEEGMPPRDKRMEHVRKSMLHSVKPFHGQTVKDTYTVIDWVEKVDTEFGINMGVRQSGRLDVVRSLLAGSALKWMNRKLQEMNVQLAAGLRTEPAEWYVIRQQFIDAHLGASTIETFKAELRTLRLGSEQCKNPSELNSQFDQLAELAYPDRRADSAMATVLGDEYRRIVASSDLYLYRNIERNAAPNTLDEWKAALVRHWGAERTIDNMVKQLRPREQPPQQQWPRGRGRGGGTAAVNAMSEGNEATGSGEGTGEGEFNTQLNAAASPGRGGGRGGYRGREGRPAFTGEKLQLYNDRKCFICKQEGHVAARCPQPPASRPQSNGRAG